MTIIKNILSVLILTVCFSVAGTAQASYAERDDVKAFINDMVEKHQYDKAVLTKWFSEADRLDSVLESIAKPAEKELTWRQYRPIFLSQKRIDLGVEFMKDNHELLELAEQVTGVPQHVITAIIGVETYYGRHIGKTPVFDSLTTLGFDYPPRSRFFKSELEHLLLLARDEDINVREVRGSYAGAMGMPQFISSSYRSYAIDFDKDGKRDLWNSKADVIGSVANYFKKHHWERGAEVMHQVTLKVAPEEASRTQLKPHTTVGDYRKQGAVVDSSISDDTMATLITLEGDDGTEYWLGYKNFYVITRYNRSSMYALAVFQLSQSINQQR